MSTPPTLAPLLAMLLTVLFATCAPQRAIAAPALSEQAAAQRTKALHVFKQGKTAYKAGDYDAALQFFRRAQAIYSHEALIILALAKTLDRAKSAQKALRYYKLYLKEASPSDRSRTKAVQRIKEIEADLAKRPARLAFKNLPTAATLRINGDAMAPNAKGELQLAPGSYDVSVSLQHHYPFSRQRVVLKAGERRELTVVLQRIPDPSTLPRDHTWTWIAGTATGVGVLTTGVVALQSFFKRSEFFELADTKGFPTEKGRKKYNCEPAAPGEANPLQCPQWESAVQALKSDEEFYRSATAVSGLVTAGFGVATVVAYFAAPVKSSNKQTTFDITPTGARSIGLTLRF